MKWLVRTIHLIGPTTRLRWHSTNQNLRFCKVMLWLSDLLSIIDQICIFYVIFPWGCHGWYGLDGIIHSFPTILNRPLLEIFPAMLADMVRSQNSSSMGWQRMLCTLFNNTIHVLSTSVFLHDALVITEGGCTCWSLVHEFACDSPRVRFL